MKFYYEKEISKLQPACPPEAYKTIERISYRWVFDTMADERNFKAQAEKNPKMVNGKSDLEVCGAYALSFHNNAEKSKEHFAFFSKKSELAYKRLGTNVAKGTLELTDGVSGPIEANGHFNFHPIKEHTFATKFEIIDKL